jgi:hypothetical protein
MYLVLQQKLFLDLVKKPMTTQPNNNNATVMAKAINGDGNSKSRGGGSGVRQRRQQWSWLGIPIFGSDFWDPHCSQDSNSMFDSEHSGWKMLLKFRCLESQKIRIPIRDIRNSGNFFAQELSTSYRC